MSRYCTHLTYRWSCLNLENWNWEKQCLRRQTALYSREVSPLMFHPRQWPCSAGLSGFGMPKGRCRALNWSGGGRGGLLADLVSCLVYFVGIESCRLAFDNALWLGNILGKDMKI